MSSNQWDLVLACLTPSPQLMPDIADAIEAGAGGMEPPDQFSDLVVSLARTERLPGSAGARRVLGMTMGDRQFAADRLDTQFSAIGFRERHPLYLGGRAPPRKNERIPCAGSRSPGGVPSPRAPATFAVNGLVRQAPPAQFAGSPSHGASDVAPRRCSQSFPRAR